MLLTPNVWRQRAERKRTKSMEQAETSNEANDSDRPNDVARLRCTPSLGSAGADAAYLFHDRCGQPEMDEGD